MARKIVRLFLGKERLGLGLGHKGHLCWEVENKRDSVQLWIGQLVMPNRQPKVWIWILEKRDREEEKRKEE